MKLAAIARALNPDHTISRVGYLHRSDVTPLACVTASCSVPTFNVDQVLQKRQAIACGGSLTNDSVLLHISELSKLITLFARPVSELLAHFDSLNNPVVLLIEEEWRVTASPAHAGSAGDGDLLLARFSHGFFRKLLEFKISGSLPRAPDVALPLGREALPPGGESCPPSAPMGQKRRRESSEVSSECKPQAGYLCAVRHDSLAHESAPTTDNEGNLFIPLPMHLSHSFVERLVHYLGVNSLTFIAVVRADSDTSWPTAHICITICLINRRRRD